MADPPMYEHHHKPKFTELNDLASEKVRCCKDIANILIKNMMGISESVQGIIFIFLRFIGV